MRHVATILFSISLAVLTAATPLIAQGLGRVVGQVIDGDAGYALPGANVVIEGTAVGTAGDRDGRFVLARVPAGRQRLVFSYIGYESKTAEVNVVAGQATSVTVSLDPAALRGGEVLVLGQRAQGQAKALVQQQNAANIMNVVASDQIGRFPDASAPDALQRVPGIGVQRDQGEGRFIQIRGAAPQLTTVTLNGERIPTPEGDVRQIALDAIPTEILESIEVSKAITPDMDADAIGGSVNLVTRRAGDEPLYTFDLAGGYGSIRGQGSMRGSATIADRIGDGRLGYVFNGTFSRRNFGSDDIEPVWDFGADGRPLGGDDQVSELQVRYYDLMRQRTGVNGMLDYRLSEGSSVYLRGLFVQLQDTEQRNRLRNRIDRGRLVYNHKNRTEYLRTLGLTAGGEHLLANGIQVDYRAAVTRSQEETPEDVEIFWEQRNVAFSPDFSDPKRVVANPDPSALQNMSAFRFNGIEPASGNTSDDDYLASVNVRGLLELGGITGSWRSGAKFRHKVKTQDVAESAFELRSGAAAILLGQDVGESFADRYDVSRFGPGPYSLPAFVMRNQETLDFTSTFAGSLEEDEVAALEGNLQDFDVTEQTIAGYAMTELNLTPSLMLLPGVRFERTAVSAVGYRSVVEEENDDGELATELVGIDRVEADNSYGFLFPMVHLRYRPGARTNIRAAFTTALARPNFFDLAPYEIRDGEEVEIGNPDLKPTRSKNFDLMVEHYTTAIGLISAGAFYKHIDDPIVAFRSRFNRVVDDEPFQITQYQAGNGESGFIWGLELALQQQLRFLPGAWSGLGVYANYTYTVSEAVLSDGSTNVYPGQADHIFNAALSYEKRGFSGQVSLNYTGGFLDEFAGDGLTADRSNDTFVEERWGLDFSAAYRLRNGLGFFVEWINLLNAPLVVYQGDAARPIQREYYRSWGWVGVRFSL